MSCILCDREIDQQNDSVEHVIPQAVGGLLKVKSLLCKDCNGWTGQEWDSTLCDQLNWFSLIFQVVRDRGAVPSMPISTVSGEELLLLNDGSMTMRRPTFEKQPLEDSKTRIHIVARNELEAKRMLTNASRKYSIDVDETLRNASTSTHYLQSPVTVNLPFGGPRTGRSIVKTAMVYAAMQGVDPALCGQARRYLLQDDRHPDASTATPPFTRLDTITGNSEENVPPFDYYYAKDLLTERPSVVLHGVCVSSRGTEGQLLAYVEYFGCHRCLVLLADDYAGPEVHTGYFIDPRTGKAVQADFELGVGKAEVQSLFRREYDDIEGRRAAYNSVMEVAIAGSFDRERERLIDQAWQALGKSGLKEGELLTEVHIAQLSRELAERLTPFLLAHGLLATRTESDDRPAASPLSADVPGHGPD